MLKSKSYCREALEDSMEKEGIRIRNTDLIRREDAIMAMKEWGCNTCAIPTPEMLIRQLPSVFAPVNSIDLIRCKDCIHYLPMDETKAFACAKGLLDATKDDYCSRVERRSDETD